MCEPAPVVVVPCRCCGGEGVVGYRVLGINYHDGSLAETWQDCPVCGGSGCEIIEGDDVAEEELNFPD